MSTYDISGLDWQTENNFSILEPSFRESEGMVKVDDAFNRDDIRMVDAVFREGYLRGMRLTRRRAGSSVTARETS